MPIPLLSTSYHIKIFHRLLLTTVSKQLGILSLVNIKLRLLQNYDPLSIVFMPTCRETLLQQHHLHIHIIVGMGGSKKNFRGEPNIVGVKVAQLNVLLELQLRTLLMISQIPV